MTVNALLLGSIGVVVETSEMQRRAFNAAFIEAELDWFWDRQTYSRLLKSSGGEKRVADFAADLGETVDAAAVHALKVAHYSRMMADHGLNLRPGLRELLDEAANRAIPVGWVTDTGTDQLAAIFDALGDQLHRDEFHFIGAGMHIANRKPAPDIYQAALSDLQVGADEALAIEDTGICAQAAVAAGIVTIGCPNAFASPQDFGTGITVVRQVGPALLDLHSMQIAAE